MYLCIVEMLHRNNFLLLVSSIAIAIESPVIGYVRNVMSQAFFIFQISSKEFYLLCYSYNIPNDANDEWRKAKQDPM